MAILAAVRLANCELILVFQADMSQSQMPYKLCDPVKNCAGVRRVAGVFCPVPKSTIIRCRLVAVGAMMANCSLVVMGDPAGTVNSGDAEAAHEFSTAPVRSKRHTLPRRSPA